jgi:dTDP-glucose 4,6-dehydratase
LYFNTVNKINIFLTGGTGFFGRALLRFLGNSSFESGDQLQVTVLSRSPNAFLNNYPEFRKADWISLHKGDILDPHSFPQYDSFTHLLHAATDSTFGPCLSPLTRYDQIVDGTRNILEYAAQNQISRFLFTSSGGVYGPQQKDGDKISESCLTMSNPLHSVNAYSVAKITAEHMCSLFRDKYGIETIIARCFAFVGPDLPLDAHFAIGNFIQDALQKEQITVKGNGAAIRSYMDQRDLAEWLLTLLFRGSAGEAYNVGSDEAVSISQLAYLVRDLLSPHKSVIILGKSVNDLGRNRYVPNIDKAVQTLGLTLRYSLKEGIVSTAETNGTKL